MSKLDWMRLADDEHEYVTAVAENGMKAIIFTSRHSVSLPVAFVQYGELRKIPNIFFVDEESAKDWCEKEMRTNIEMQR